MSPTPAWRTFRFFETQTIVCPEPLQAATICCCAVGTSYLVTGDVAGDVSLYDRGSFALRARFQAYLGAVTQLKFVQPDGGPPWLCTLGNDLNTMAAAATGAAATQVAILRLWRLDDVFMHQHRDTSGGSATTPHAVRSDGIYSRSSSAAVAERSSNAATVVPPQCEYCVFLEEASSSSSSRWPAVMDTTAVLPQLPVTCTATHAKTGSRDGDDTRLRNAVVSFDIASDLRNAAVGLTNDECLLLHGELGQAAAHVARRWLRSGVARDRLTLVALPARTHVQVASSALHPPDTGGALGVLSPNASLVAAGSLLRRGLTRPGSSSSAVAPKSPTQLRGDVAGVSAATQVLYIVYEDVVTVWTVKEGGAVHEHRCPMPWGAAPRAACLLRRGALAVLSGDGTQMACLGLAQTQPTEAAASLSVTQTCYDPTLASSVQVVSLVPSHQPGCAPCAVVGYRDYTVVLTRPPAQREQAGHDDHFALQCYDMQHGLRGLGRGQDRYERVAFVLSDTQDILLVLATDDDGLSGGVTTTTAPSCRRADTLVRLTELELPARLELLFRRECYDVAASLVMSAAPAVRYDVQRRYADYLYAKGRLADAMTQYVGTIGQLEPSYVIRRYLSTEHMALLITYLEALHVPHGTCSPAHAMVTGPPVGLQTSHTTLLLHCYLKCGAQDKLRAFVHRDDLRLDAASAIAVCRQGGDYATALYIAERYAMAEAYVEIEFYDRHHPHAALHFVHHLPVDAVEALFGGSATSRAMGKDFLRAVPAAMTALLVELCVHWPGPARRLPRSTTATVPGVVQDGSTWLDDQVRRPAHRALASHFVPLLHDMPVCLFHFLRAIIASGVLDEGSEMRPRGDAANAAVPQPSIGADAHTAVTVRAARADVADLADADVTLYNILYELYLTPDLTQDNMSDDEDEVMARRPDGETSEAVRKGGSDKGDNARGATTGQASAPTSHRADDRTSSNNGTAAAIAENDGHALLSTEPLEWRRAQAMAFLQMYDGRYDIPIALALSYRFSFDDGVVFLLQRLGWWDELIYFYEDKMCGGARSTCAATKGAVTAQGGGGVAAAAGDEVTPVTQADAVARRGWAAALVQACFTAEEMAMAPAVKAREEAKQKDKERGDSSSSSNNGDVAVVERVRAMWLLGVASLLRGGSAVTPDQLSLVLEHVVASPGLLSPALVLGLLGGAAQDTATLAAARVYCEQMQQRQSLTEDAPCTVERRSADGVRALAKLQREHDALQSGALVFASPLCTQCGHPLDLPAVYFFCHHAFHRRCLNVATECNVCGAQQHHALDALDHAVLLANEATRAAQTTSVLPSASAPGVTADSVQQSAATRMSVIYASLVDAPRATCSLTAVIEVLDQAAEEDAVQAEAVELW